MKAKLLNNNIMRDIFIVPILLVVFMCSSCTGQNTEESLFSKGENILFRIKSPCDPTVDTTDFQIFESINIYCSSGSDKYQLIAINYSDNTYSSDSLDNIDFDLDYTQKKFTKDNQLKILNTVPKSIRGYPGKEFRYQYLTEDRIRFTRVYIIKNTLYKLIYEGTTKDAFNNKIDDYFDSFEPIDIMENSNPYITLPSKEELANLPFKVVFPGKTIQRVDVQESFFGKAPLIMNLLQSSNPDTDNYLALMTSYTPLPTGLNSEDHLRLINEQREMLENNQIDSELIEVRIIENGKEYISSYRLGGKKVLDRRQVVVYDDNYLVIVALRLFEQDESGIINEFFKSVELE